MKIQGITFNKPVLVTTTRANLKTLDKYQSKQLEYYGEKFKTQRSRIKRTTRYAANNINTTCKNSRIY